MGRTSDFVAKEYGYSVETNERVVALGAAAPVQVMQNNPNRFGWTIFNLGANIAYVSFSGTIPGVANGILIAANGGFISINARDEGELPVRQMFGISPAGVTNLYVVETVAIV